MPTQIRSKFRVWADRSDSTCKIRAEGRENAEWLISHLVSQFPTLRTSELRNIQDTPVYAFEVYSDDQAPLLRIHRSLRELADIDLLRIFPMRINEMPHYSVSSDILATWIEQQGDGMWWNVDGDPELESRLEFPCPTDELASALREFGGALLVSDPKGLGGGQQISQDQLSNVVESEELGVKALYLSRDGVTDWLLTEAEPYS